MKNEGRRKSMKEIGLDIIKDNNMIKMKKYKTREEDTRNKDLPPSLSVIDPLLH